MVEALPARQETGPGVVLGEFHTNLGDGRVRCEVCPRFCTLGDGQRGFCFIRQAQQGEVVLTSYGRSSGFCVDPIEKKPLNHFFPGSSVLSFGTAGCNLGCRFCQNWDISNSRQADRLGSKAYPNDIAEAARRSGCVSVAFTYNDPVPFLEYAVDTAEVCHDFGLKTVAVTAGYIVPAARARFYQHIDAANVDLKAFTEQFYHKLCFAQLAPVLDTLRYLKHETDVWFEVTTLLIPGQNDSDEEIGRLCDWMVENVGPEVPLHFSAFHPDFKMTGLPRTPTATLTRARERARQAGMGHVYTGNVHDARGQSTYCASCGHLLIERDWYELGAWGLAKGCCEKCGESLPGHYDEGPGGWGSQRMRVIMPSWD